MSPRTSRRVVAGVLVLLVGGAAALWLREHRAAAQRALLERALQSQSVGPAPGPAAEPEVAEGVPQEFWDAYYSDPDPPPGDDPS